MTPALRAVLSAVAAWVMLPTGNLSAARSATKPPVFQKISTPDFSGSYHVASENRTAPDADQGFRFLCLVESPAGVAYQIETDLTINPNRLRTGWKTGLARTVCEGVFLDSILDEEEPSAPPILLKFSMEPGGNIRVATSGAIDHFPYFSYSDFDGLYRKEGQSAESIDPEFSKAEEVLRELDERCETLDAREKADLSKKAALLIGGGSALAESLREAAEDGAKSRTVVRLVARVRKGDYQAMRAVFAWLGGASGRLHTDPGFALACYEKGKKLSPDFAVVFEGADRVGQKGESALAALSDEKSFGTPLLLEVTKTSHECGPLNLEQLQSKHGLTAAALTKSREVLWELAEEASRGGRFGRPNPRLALQFMVRADGKLKEVAEAVRAFRMAWKTGSRKPVNVLSRNSQRTTPTELHQNPQTVRPPEAVSLEEVQRTVGMAAEPALEQASGAAVDFINAASHRFSGDFGFPSREANRRTFCAAKLQDFLRSVIAVRDGFSPEELPDFDAADAEMSWRYADALLWLGSEKNVFFSIEAGTALDLYQFDSVEQLRTVQRLWIKHRDKCAALFHQLNSNLSELQWKAWFTKTRSDELARLMEQTGVPRQVLEPLQDRKQRLNREFLELYDQYEKLPKDSFTRGLVKPGISSPISLAKKLVGQAQRIVQDELQREPPFPWKQHGAFAQIYQPLVWSTLLEQAVNFTEAALRCNPPELAADISGFYEDFEGGVVCVVKEENGYLVVADCQRTVRDVRTSLVFSGELLEDTITGAPKVAGKPGPRLLIGRGLVCLEPRTEEVADFLVNTYVRTGVLNESGCTLIREMAAKQHLAPDNPAQSAEAQVFRKSRLAWTFGAGDTAHFVEGYTPSGLKRFGPTRYSADFREASSESRRLLSKIPLKD
jgi:uncharacterized protein YecT (DUF1311 family)